MKKIIISLYSRTIQKLVFVFIKLVKFRIPQIINGDGSDDKIVSILKTKNIDSVLLCFSNTLFKSGALNPLLNKFKEEKINFCIYNNIPQNPTISSVEIGLDKYKENDAKAIIAIGGGSVIDCAKIIAARASNNKTSVQKMKGVLKIRKQLPLFIASPTTAGSGSECTLAAVISDPENKDKYAISDPKIIPNYAYLEPMFLLSLPGHITSTTGMDALTHAIESYIGNSNTKFTKIEAKEAVKLIFDNLEKSYLDPNNIVYRNNMMMASYKAGLAFTRAYVGYVHSIAHALGGTYNIAHGLANAILLDKVLIAYDKSAYKKLSELYDTINPNTNLSIKEKAEEFIKEIQKLKKSLNIVNNLSEIIKEDDLDYLVNHAYKEAVPFYPTPRILSRNEIKNILIDVMNNK